MKVKPKHPNTCRRGDCSGCGGSGQRLHFAYDLDRAGRGAWHDGLTASAAGVCFKIGNCGAACPDRPTRADLTSCAGQPACFSIDTGTAGCLDAACVGARAAADDASCGACACGCAAVGSAAGTDDIRIGAGNARRFGAGRSSAAGAAGGSAADADANSGAGGAGGANDVADTTEDVDGATAASCYCGFHQSCC